MQRFTRREKRFVLGGARVLVATNTPKAAHRSRLSGAPWPGKTPVCSIYPGDSLKTQPRGIVGSLHGRRSSNCASTWSRVAGVSLVSVPWGRPVPTGSFGGSTCSLVSRGGSTVTTVFAPSSSEVLSTGVDGSCWEVPDGTPRELEAPGRSAGPKQGETEPG